MRPSIPATEIGLALIFISRSLTRIYQRRAIADYGVTGARLGGIPGSGVIPPWVSLLAVLGWLSALAAGAWIVLG